MTEQEKDNMNNLRATLDSINIFSKEQERDDLLIGYIVEDDGTLIIPGSNDEPLDPEKFILTLVGNILKVKLPEEYEKGISVAVHTIMDDKAGKPLKALMVRLAAFLIQKYDPTEIPDVRVPDYSSLEDEKDDSVANRLGGEGGDSDA